MESKLYVPSHFKVDEDDEVIGEVLTQHPFATVIITQENIPHIVHMPLLFDATTHHLKGHIAKANGISKLDLTKPHHCMAIFQGPDAYVSPSWYQTKIDSGKVVPTWNYVTVHVEGRINLIQDRDWILQNVSALSDKHEQSIGSSWRVSDAPSSYIDGLIRAVTGVDIAITSWQGKLKLSQNKNDGDFNGVVEGMKKTGKDNDRRTAEWMERIRNRSHDK